ncbi:guanylate kinase [Bythopirellula goksoeyrii]|uniref:Guanylate kinase n=1 Tax=Bythopirellula goksoeyrii TaxID=1400387 RepID=A0A5B9QAM7_9BACT|nr:guanylate kinase [Bythopirellula goksoeyrii]QEG34799.1 Guanylate kinase [Bythopirellula goksoeyrii]
MTIAPGKSDVPGRLVVVSGPSGVGKSTVVKQVLERLAGRLVPSISATTRDPRSGETDGVDYFFLSPAEFTRRREAGDFLETAEVFGRGHWYGTLWSAVRPSLSAGKWVLLEIDVAGAEEVLRQFPDALTIFIQPSTIEELERRLRSRATETPAAIERRLEVARREIALARRYKYQVVNDTVSKAVEEIVNQLQNEGIPND